jgi:hypothetical protein
MSNTGYIYVLINPSMAGLVKIGKTTRDPAGRARELSGATGVPSPFVVAYDAFFDDCSSAEEFVHALLEQNGYRVSSNREFFSASVSEAIKAVMEAERVLGSSHPAELGLPGDNVPSGQTPLGVMAWDETLQRAQESYRGYDRTIQDHVEASRLFKVAARLGSSVACMMLGIMSKNGEACKKDSTAAVEFFKQGLRLGDDRCWAEMAMLFLQDGHYENANKCWHNYFGSNWFREDKRTPDGYGSRRISYLVRCYISLGPTGALVDPQRVQFGSFPASFKKELSPIKQELLTEVRAALDRNIANNGLEVIASYEKLLDDLEAQI